MSTEYKLSTIIKYRAGTGDDPYIPITQSSKVVNQTIRLNEIPDFNAKVLISGMFELFDLDEEDLLSNQYRIDYSEGLASFHSSKEGQTITLTYKGRGNHFISADRVWTQESNGNVTETLEDLIDAGDTALANLGLVNAAIANAQTATTNANNAAASISTVVSGESARVTAENTRKSNETTRTTNETTRVSNENTRIASESGRVSAETTRASAETTRIGNESTRQSNESTRQTQESARQTNTTTAITNLNNLKNSFLYDKNVYSSTKSYTVNNLITYQGRTYICILNTTGNPPTNATYWQVFAEKGFDGLGTVTALTSTSGDIIIDGTAVYPDLSVNAGVNPNQIVKRNGTGDIVGNITGKAATVTTNANLSGAITSVGNVTTLSSGIDAAKIANGSITNTEFQYLDGATSNLQLQINSKASLTSLISAGLGVAAPIVADLSDLPIASGSGFYTANATTLNKPPGAGDGSVVHIARDSRPSQLFMEHATNKIFYRGYISTGYQVWHSVLTDAGGFTMLANLEMGGKIVNKAQDLRLVNGSRFGEDLNQRTRINAHFDRLDIVTEAGVNYILKVDYTNDIFQFKGADVAREDRANVFGLIQTIDTGQSGKLELGAGSTDVYIHNTASNKYLSLKNDGSLQYGGVDVILASGGKSMTDFLSFANSKGIYAKNGNNTSLFDIDFPEATSAAAGVRFFRNTTTTGIKSFTLHDGTSNQSFKIENGTITALSGSPIMIRAGVGSPEGVYTASVGSIYTRTDGSANTTLYVKESGTGNVGWKAK